MSTGEAAIPAQAAACPLCATPAPAGAARCSECGYDLAGIGGRAKAFSRPVLLGTAMGFFVVYLVTLAIVVLTR